MSETNIKQLFKFYGIEIDPANHYDLDIYIFNLEQLINIQARQIERLQERLKATGDTMSTE